MQKLFTCLFLLLGYAAQAQYKFPEHELAREVKGRTLGVQLVEADSHQKQSLNRALKAAFKENWTLTPVEFFTAEEINSLLSSKNKKYALLLQSDIKHGDKIVGTINENGERITHAIGGTKRNNYQDIKHFRFTNYSFNLLLPDSKQNVTSVGFANSDLSKIDYLFLVQQLNRLVAHAIQQTPLEDYYNVESNIETVKNYKLYLLEDFFKEKDILNMDKHYGFGYEVVGYDVYQEKILEKAPDAAYVKIVWSNLHQTYAWLVIDSSDGEVLALTGLGGISGSHDASDIIKAKQLKYITSKSIQKLNNRYK